MTDPFFGHHPQVLQIRPPRHKSLQAHLLVLQHVAAFGHRVVFDNLDVGILFEPADKVDALPCPAGEEAVIDVAAVQCDDASLRKIKALSHFDVAHLALGYVPKNRQVSIVIQ